MSTIKKGHVTLISNVENFSAIYGLDFEMIEEKDLKDLYEVLTEFFNSKSA